MVLHGRFGASIMVTPSTKQYKYETLRAFVVSGNKFCATGKRSAITGGHVYRPIHSRKAAKRSGYWVYRPTAPEVTSMSSRIDVNGYAPWINGYAPGSRDAVHSGGWIIALRVGWIIAPGGSTGSFRRWVRLGLRWVRVVVFGINDVGCYRDSDERAGCYG